MKYILFLMFFTAQPTANPKNQVWMLQSTSTMEFTEKVGCDRSAERLIASIKKTATVKLFGWCFANNSGQEAIKGITQKEIREFIQKDESLQAPDYYSGAR